MVRETELTPAHLMLPLFVQLGEDERTPIEAMPGVDRLSISRAVGEAGAAHELGIPAILLFGVPSEKDEQASGAYDDEGVVQLAVRALKEAHPELVVITDVCLCAYTSHGHCGVVLDDGTVDNDLTRAVSAVFPFKPTLDALDAALNDAGGLGGPLLHLAALALGFGVLSRLALKRFA